MILILKKIEGKKKLFQIVQKSKDEKLDSMLLNGNHQFNCFSYYDNHFNSIAAVHYQINLHLFNTLSMPLTS